MRVGAGSPQPVFIPTLTKYLHWTEFVTEKNSVLGNDLGLG